MAPILEVRELFVRFGKTDVLRGVTFDHEAGSAVAVIGPNGAGKSVLFKALMSSVPTEVRSAGRRMFALGTCLRSSTSKETCPSRGWLYWPPRLK